MILDDESVLQRAASGPDETYRYGSHADQVIDIWPGEDWAGRPLVAFLHGGFWRPAYDRIHARPLAVALRAAGWPVACLEYRRSPGEPLQTLDDVRHGLAALAHVDGAFGASGQVVSDEPHGSPRGIVLMGHSAGGHLALWAAATLPLPGLVGTVVLGAVADLRMAQELGLGGGSVRDFLGAEYQRLADIDPVGLPTPGTPTVLVHGAEDPWVPVALARSYIAAHPRARLVELAAAGHFGVIDPSSAVWTSVVEELERMSSGSVTT